MKNTAQYNLKDKKKAVAYILTASKGDDGTVQRHRIIEFCERESLQLIRIVSDMNQSGMERERPGLKDLFSFLEQHRGIVDHVIVNDLSTISRSLNVGFSILHSIKSLGVTIRNVDGQNNLLNPNSDSPSQLNWKTSNLMNEREVSEIVSKRIKEGIRHAKLKGRFVGKPPFGYVNGMEKKGNQVIRVDKKKAKIVRVIFREYLSGTPLSQILRMTREMGFTSSGKIALIKILENSVYAGFIKIDGKGNSPSQLIKGTHQPIIDKTDYWSVQDKLESLKKRKMLTKQKRIR